MSYELSFILPGLPKTMNDRMHWAVKAKENKKWTNMVHYMTFGKRPISPLKQAHLILTRFSTREPDYDNLVSGFKPIIDALVTCEILENDHRQCIGISDYRWERAPQKQGKVRIQVAEQLNFSFISSFPLPHPQFSSGMRIKI